MEIGAQHRALLAQPFGAQRQTQRTERAIRRDAEASEAIPLALVADDALRLAHRPGQRLATAGGQGEAEIAGLLAQRDALPVAVCEAELSGSAARQQKRRPILALQLNGDAIGPFGEGETELGLRRYAQRHPRRENTRRVAFGPRQAQRRERRIALQLSALTDREGNADAGRAHRNATQPRTRGIRHQRFGTGAAGLRAQIVGVGTVVLVEHDALQGCALHRVAHRRGSDRHVVGQRERARGVRRTARQPGGALRRERARQIEDTATVDRIGPGRPGIARSVEQYLDHLLPGQVRKGLRQQRHCTRHLRGREARSRKQGHEGLPTLLGDLDFAILVGAANPLSACGEETGGVAARAVAEIRELALVVDRADDDHGPVAPLQGGDRKGIGVVRIKRGVAGVAVVPGSDHHDDARLRRTRDRVGQLGGGRAAAEAQIDDPRVGGNGDIDPARNVGIEELAPLEIGVVRTSSGAAARFVRPQDEQARIVGHAHDAFVVERGCSHQGDVGAVIVDPVDRAGPGHVCRFRQNTPGEFGAVDVDPAVDDRNGRPLAGNALLPGYCRVVEFGPVRSPHLGRVDVRSGGGRRSGGRSWRRRWRRCGRGGRSWRRNGRTQAGSASTAGTGAQHRHHAESNPDLQLFPTGSLHHAKFLCSLP